MGQRYKLGPDSGSIIALLLKEHLTEFFPGDNSHYYPISLACMLGRQGKPVGCAWTIDGRPPRTNLFRTKRMFGFPQVKRKSSLTVTAHCFVAADEAKQGKRLACALCIASSLLPYPGISAQETTRLFSNLNPRPSATATAGTCGTWPGTKTARQRYIRAWLRFFSRDENLTPGNFRQIS